MSDTTPRLSVDIVSDVMCPWCIIGWLKFEKVMAHFEGRLAFRVQWHPFELNPDMQPEGEDAAAADVIFYELMGDDVAPRRRFIQSNAAHVKNLDI